MSSGLSDALRHLADGPSPEPKSSPPPETPEAPPPEQPRHDEPMEARRPRQAASQGQSPSRPVRRSRKKKPSPLLVVMVPALLLVATVALALAVWGTLVLAGMHVWRSEAPKADVMAKAMLAAYPVAVCLYVGAIYFALQSRG